MTTKEQCVKLFTASLNKTSKFYNQDLSDFKMRLIKMKPLEVHRLHRTLLGMSTLSDSLRTECNKMVNHSGFLNNNPITSLS